MKRITLFLCIFAMLHAIETEDRIRQYEEKYQTHQRIEKPISPQPQFTPHRDIITLIDEDFETGMPIEWTVIDGNNDGFTWTTGTTFDLYGVHPPNYGTAYAYYSDDDAGLGAPAGTEYLISPSVRCAGAESLSLSYSWGFNAIENPFGATYVRFHDDTTWTNWNLIAFYIFLGNGDTIIDLSSNLPAESIQVQYTYEDLDGVKGGAFGIDNVLLEAYIITEYVWDFETGEQGWTHTNGGTFPAAWDVVESNYTVGSFVIAPPSAGDSSFCIDGNLGGICHDTAMSPAVNNPGFAWFKWGMHFQDYDTNQTFTVIMRTYSSGSWNPWTDVWTYTADTPPRYDSVEVPAAVTDSVQVGFVYDQPNATYAWFAAFDNVELAAPPSHDVGCMAVVSPPEGYVIPGNYGVIGQIHNFGSSEETVYIYAEVYDTIGMQQIFTQTLVIPNFPAGGDSNVNLGQVTFNPNLCFLTTITATCTGDSNSYNDTASAWSRTMLGLGDVFFEMDIEAICNDNQLLGLEFDGERFYITGGNNGTDPNKLYVVDTSGTLLWTLDQTAHSIGWGWRDVAWDNVYAGLNRIDTLYASEGPIVDYFSIDLIGGILQYHGSSPGVTSPNRALAYCPDSGWFYTANYASDCYKFAKSGVILQSVANTYAMYGAAYDYGLYGWDTYVWWHSQDDPGTGFQCQIIQMDPYTMSFLGTPFGFTLPAALTDAVAGGLCSSYYGGWPEHDVLFALLQGTPHDYVVGIYLRGYGIDEGTSLDLTSSFGFAATQTTVVKNRASVTFTIITPCHVSLTIYDITGRLVRTLVHGYEEPGLKQMNWDGTDGYGRKLSSGVYFLNLQAGDYTETRKILLIR